MAEDRSRYYRIKLFDPDGKEISKRIFRIYPEEKEHGDKWAKMQAAKLSYELAMDAMDHATRKMGEAKNAD